MGSLTCQKWLKCVYGVIVCQKWLKFVYGVIDLPKVVEMCMYGGQSPAQKWPTSISIGLKYMEIEADDWRVCVRAFSLSSF